MSAEPRQTTNTEAWTKWENQIVDGRFALRRCLGWSDHGAVFLTEHKAKNLAEAAIKVVRADAPQAKALLVHWQAAIPLSHPHLVQLFEVGRWQSEGKEFLFVVMEYADQTLAELLRRRALSAEEVQELLPPVLDALTFLHRRQLVHGQLKPSNFLAVGDRLKLASDTIRAADKDHGISTADDVWSLGVTLCEAVTARTPTSSDRRFDVTSLPAGLPAHLVETVRRCLSAAPADRPTIIELRAENKPGAPPAAAQVAKPEPPKQKVSEKAAPPLPAQTVAREAAVPPPVPDASREAAPPPPAPSTSREVSLPRPAPSTSRDGTPPQPVLNTSREVTPPRPAISTSRELTPPQPVLSASREVTPPQSAPSASREVTALQPAPSASRESPSPQPGLSTSRESASPAPSASRETASPPAAPRASKEIALPQPVPRASKEVTPPQPVPGASKEVTPPQPVPGASKEVTPPQPAPRASKEVTPPQPAPRASSEATPPQSAPKRHLLLSGVVAVLLLLLAVWGGSRFTDKSQPPLQPAVVPEPTPVAPSAPVKVAAPKPTLSRPVSPAPEQPAPPPAASSAVLHEVLPTVPEKIQNKIQGRVYVTVRVLVDPEGNIIGALMENAGPSKYFARLSDEAARQWQFVPADTQAARVWLLRFEFTRKGVAVRTIEQ